MAAWSTDERTQDAVVRNLEAIGEAVERLPVQMRAAGPDVPWQDIVMNEVPALHRAVLSPLE